MNPQHPWPVLRKAAWPPNPVTAPAPLNVEEQAQRVEALRNQVRYVHMNPKARVEHFLRLAGWDVNPAAALAWTNEVRRRPDAAHLPTHRRAKTVGQGRVHLVHDFQKALKTIRRELRLSNAVLVLLLHDHRWVQRDVIEYISTREDDGGFDHVYDRLAALRLPPNGNWTCDKRLALLISVTSTNRWSGALRLLQKHDWDLALAIDEWLQEGRVLKGKPKEIRGRKKKSKNDETGTRMWSANQPRRYVRGAFDYNDDETDVEDDEPPSQPSMPPRPGDKEKAPDKAPGDKDEDAEVEWGPTEPLQEALREPTRRWTDIAEIDGRDYVKEQRSSRSAFIIEEDREPAATGAPDESKLRVEFIKKGAYGHHEFKGKFVVDGESLSFRWDDLDTAPGVEFDWNNRDHIHKLNRWRREMYLGLTGVLARDPVIPFNKYERDWLREQEAMRIEDKFYTFADQDPDDVNITNQTYYGNTMRTFHTGSKFPIRLSRAEAQLLTEAFNETFAGKRQYVKSIVRQAPGGPCRIEQVNKDMSKVGHVPRPARSLATIREQRHRIRSLAKHFGLVYTGSGGVAADLESELDSDFANEDLVSESDSDF